MTSLLDKLNLRPGERRLVVFVGLVVFAAVNIWFVLPEFGKVATWKQRRASELKKLDDFNREINKKGVYERELKELEKLGGQIAADEQAIQLARDIDSLARLSSVQVESYSPMQRQGSGGRTNAFFEEQSIQISVTSGERELVDFLYNLGQRNSLIRVRTMTLQPDPTRMRLKARIELVASYQKKAPVRTIPSALASAKPGSPASKTNTPPTRTNAPAGTTTKPPATKAPTPPAKTLMNTAKPPVTPTGATATKTNASGRVRKPDGK